jgi:hypothetical protein
MRTLLMLVTLASLGGSLSAQGWRNSRNGFWLGFGVADGSAGLDCFSCSTDRVAAVSGYINAGGSISRHFLLGAEANGWANYDQGVNETIGYGGLVALIYPSATGGFYLKLGVGGMNYRLDDGFNVMTAGAPAGELGVGYEARIGRSASIVPFVNVLGSSPVQLDFNGQPQVTGEDIRINLVQFGVGLSWH